MKDLKLTLLASFLLTASFAFTTVSAEIIAEENPINKMYSLLNNSEEISHDEAEKMMDQAMELSKSGKPFEFPWTRHSIAYVNSGSAKEGKIAHKKLKCHKCHGDEGISEDDDSPSIAGQLAAYTFKQLYDYKVGLRQDKDMRKKVRKMTSKQIADVAAYYSTLKPEKKVKSENVPHLAKNGDKSRFLIACEKCHNLKAMKRGHQTPIIEGQKVEYFIDTMNMFKDKDRSNDHWSVMTKIVSKLSDKEIEELSRYYSAKPEDDDEDED